MGIDVKIVVGADETSSSAEVSGSIQHIITPEERTSFGINDGQLKSAVEKYFGKAPKDAYVSSPTPWGDLYKTYGWEQVSVVLVPVKAEILGITSNPTILKTQKFINSSSVTGTFNVGITESVTNTVSSSWSTGGTLTVGEKISYGIKIEGVASVGGEISISYSQSWGIGGEESSSATVGSSSGVTVVLEPGESVVSELSASRGEMRVLVTYDAYLKGYVAVNYDPTYKDHHFWALPISEVMSAAGISNSAKSNETMNIGYYSNARVELKDKLMASATGYNTAEQYAQYPYPHLGRRRW